MIGEVKIPPSSIYHDYLISFINNEEHINYYPTAKPVNCRL
jgi:hypothetical protein